MTNGTLVTLALAATGLLIVGARLLEQPSPLTLVIGVLTLATGTALAAAAVAGAWRTPRPAVDEQPTVDRR